MRRTHNKVERLLGLGALDVEDAGHARRHAVQVGEVRVALAHLPDVVPERLVDVGLRHAHALPGRVRREAHADARGPDGGAHGVEDLEREPCAVLDRAAVLVGALVRHGLEELVEEVACARGGKGSSARRATAERLRQ